MASSYPLPRPGPGHSGGPGRVGPSALPTPANDNWPKHPTPANDNVPPRPRPTGQPRTRMPGIGPIGAAIGAGLWVVRALGPDVQNAAEQFLAHGWQVTYCTPSQPVYKVISGDMVCLTGPHAGSYDAPARTSYVFAPGAFRARYAGWDYLGHDAFGRPIMSGRFGAVGFLGTAQPFTLRDVNRPMFVPGAGAAAAPLPARQPYPAPYAPWFPAPRPDPVQRPSNPNPNPTPGSPHPAQPGSQPVPEPTPEPIRSDPRPVSPGWPSEPLPPGSEVEFRPGRRPRLRNQRNPRRPRRGERETKHHVRWRGTLRRIIEYVPEGVDHIDVAFECLSKKGKRNMWKEIYAQWRAGRRRHTNPLPQDKILALARNPGEFDPACFLVARAQMEAEDSAWGRTGQFLGEAGRIHGNLFGFGVGPWDMPVR